MNSILSGQKRFLVILVILSFILAACGTSGLDKDTLIMLTQTAIAATQTAISLPPAPAVATPQPSPVIASTQIPSTPTSEVIPSVSMSACDKDPGAASAFWVYKDASFTKNHFIPSGYMGDTGDLNVNPAAKENPCSGDTSIKIVYKLEGKGPNSCDYAPPCKWVGVYWMEPANNWGQTDTWKDKGYDLTGFKRLKFWARAEQNGQIDFKTGGIAAPFGDSLIVPRAVRADLTPEWQPFEIDLQDADLSYIIGGFVFSSSWQQNPDGITFYVDNIRFEK